MRIFLDSSVLVAAAGSAGGAARAVFSRARRKKWTLVTAGYCVAEVNRNVGKLRGARPTWEGLFQTKLVVVPNALSLSRPLLLTAGKDKPVLISAIAAQADVLLTLDRRDFGLLLNTSVYRVYVLMPADFLAVYG